MRGPGKAGNISANFFFLPHGFERQSLRKIRPDGHPIWKLPFFKFVQKQFPQNVSEETLAFMASLQHVYDRLFKALKSAEQNYIKQNAQQMTPQQRRLFIRYSIEADKKTYWSPLHPFTRPLNVYFRKP